MRKWFNYQREIIKDAVKKKEGAMTLILFIASVLGSVATKFGIAPNFISPEKQEAWLTDTALVLFVFFLLQVSYNRCQKLEKKNADYKERERPKLRVGIGGDLFGSFQQENQPPHTRIYLKFEQG